MPQTDYFDAGNWDATCDQCGRGFKFSALTKRWDNAWTCDACWEPRQPQDFVRAVRDNSSAPVARPRLGVPTGLSYYWVNNYGTPLLFLNDSGAALTWTPT